MRKPVPFPGGDILKTHMHAKGIGHHRNHNPVGK